MKTRLCLGLIVLASGAAHANFIGNPGFDLGPDGLQAWEGFHLPAGAVVAPSNFVTVASGTALVRGYGVVDGETAFYQTFTVAGGALVSGTYTWSAALTNITDTGARMFVKVWDTDGFIGFNGLKFQNVLLTNGVMTLTYEHEASDLVQFGFSCSTTNPLLGFDISSPVLVLLSAAPATITSSVAAISGAAPGVSFTSEAGVSYTLEYTAELAGTPVNWQAVETKVGSGGILILGTNAPILDRRLFRVVTP